jgi:hypothetical protein
LFFLTACAGDPMPPPDETPIQLRSLCTELARADCDRLNACGTLSAPFDLALCRLRQEHVACAPVQAALQASFDAGSLMYFELAARDCRAAIANLPCTVGLQHELLGLDACGAMIAGVGDDGDPCHLGLACADGFRCAAEGECPGRCRAYRQNNETCGIGNFCAPDLYCSVTGMRCRARVDLSGVCELSLDNNACRDGGFCDSSNPARMTCIPVRGRGQGCTSSFECIIGARCINSRCSAGEVGDTCGDTDDCSPGLACQAGACAVPLAIDQPCSPNSLPCAEGLACTSSVGVTACHPRPTAGVRCDADCYLSRCSGGVCAPAVLPEEACAATAECFPGHACEMSVCRVEPISCEE